MLQTSQLHQELEAAHRASESFHSLLVETEAASGPLRPGFETAMREHKLDYGPRFLCNCLRPHFITAPMLDYVEHAVGTLTRVLRRLGRAGAADPELQDFVGMTADEKELAACGPQDADAAPITRMDAFLGPQGVHLVEYNAESPTGVGYNQRLFRLFDDFGPMRRFVAENPCLVTDGTDDVLDTLLAAYQLWGGREQPRIAIVDWSHVVTRGEFEIFAEHFCARGVPTMVVDPRELELSNGVLRARGEPINLVFRRLLLSDLLAARADCAVLEEAWRRQVACFVNPLRNKFLHKKLSFALFRHEGLQGLMSDEERALVDRHVPWTARLAAGPLTRDGRRYDAAEYVVAHQADLVLKPNDDYGGHGLVLGSEVDAPTWRQAVTEALGGAADPARMCVIQQRIPLFQETFPDLDGHLSSCYVDLDPFFFGDRMLGFLTRVSRQAVSNVSSGGSQVPTYVLATR